MQNTKPIRIPLLCLALALWLALMAAATPALLAADSSSASVSVPASEAGEAGATEEEGPRQAAPGEAGLHIPPFAPAAEAVCMVSEETGSVVYEKNADTPVVAASLVKMVTAMLVVDEVQNPDTTMVASDKSWIYDELYGQNASHADIRLGESLSVTELLYALLLPSGNEAALLLADHVSSGYMPNFIYMMNQRAEKLGCTGTTFVDANGLSEGNITTARDMCRIVSAYLSYPQLAEIAATPLYEIAQHEQHDAPYNIQSTDKLVTPSSPYYSAFSSVEGRVRGGKTGSLGDWQNFASQGSDGETTYSLAVMMSPNEADTLGASLVPAQERPALYESARLYDWAFTQLELRAALDTTQPITEIPVRYSAELASLMLLPESDLRTILRIDQDDAAIEKTFDLPEYLAAPVTQGQQVGTVTLSVSGQVIGSSPLLAAQDVSRNSTLFAIRKVQEFFGSSTFKVIILVVVVSVILYIGLVTISAFLKQSKNDRKNSGGGE